MKIEIQKERETPLLSRKRITAMISFEGSTPSRTEIKNALAKKVGVDSELVIIKHVYPRFGLLTAKVISHIYDKKEDKEKVEREYLLKKHVVKQSKVEEKPAETAPAAPVEETKPAEEPATKIEAPKEAPVEEKAEEAKEEAPTAPVEEAKKEPVVEEKAEEKPVE